MGLRKIARGAGKVGMLIEGLGYIVIASRALVQAVKGRAADRAGTDDAGTDGPVGQSAASEKLRDHVTYGP